MTNSSVIDGPLTRRVIQFATAVQTSHSQSEMMAKSAHGRGRTMNSRCVRTYRAWNAATTAITNTYASPTAAALRGGTTWRMNSAYATTPATQPQIVAIENFEIGEARGKVKSYRRLRC